MSTQGNQTPQNSGSDQSLIDPKQQSNLTTIRSLLNKHLKEFENAVPKHLPAERLIRIFLTNCQRNPKLLQCHPITLIGALLQCGQLGLEPDSQTNRAHLVPFWNSKLRRYDCQFIAGYRGLIDLAIRSDEVINITPRIVREGDHFDYEYGLNERLIHRPHNTLGKLTHVYAIAEMKNGAKTFLVMTLEELEKAKKYTKSRDRNGNICGPWLDNFEEMCLKTVVRRITKYLPMSTEKAVPLQKAVSLDERAETGVPQDLGSLIDPGEATPAEAEVVQEPEREGEQAPAAAPKAPSEPREKVHPRPDDTQIDALLNTKLGKEIAVIADRQGLPEKELREYLKDRCMETAPAKLLGERFEELKEWVSGGFNAGE